jgi:hypothetical protein
MNGASKQMEYKQQVEKRCVQKGEKRGDRKYMEWRKNS